MDRRALVCLAILVASASFLIYVQPPWSSSAPVDSGASRNGPTEIGGGIEEEPEIDYGRRIVSSEEGMAPQVDSADGFRLLGIVRDKNGIPGSQGMSIFVHRIGRSGSPYLAAVTEDDGRFVLDGLDSNGLFEVWGASTGVVTEVVRVVPSRLRGELEIRAGRVWIARIEAVDRETGLALRRGIDLDTAGAGMLERFTGGGEVERCPVADDRLTGTGLSNEVFEDNERLRWTFFAWTGFTVASPPRSEVTLRIPGFQEAKCALKYSLASSNESPSSQVELNPLVDGWGTIELNLLGLPEVDRNSAQLRVRLVRIGDAGGAPRWVEFAAKAGKSAPWAVEVPAGNYRVTAKMLGFELGADALDIQQLHVEAGDVVPLVLDFGRMHQVEFVLSDADGLEYLGPFGGSFRRGIGEAQALLNFYFQGPPYTFIGLPEGEYSLMVDPPVMFPRPADPASAGAKFRVGPETAGIVHDLEVVF